MQIPYKNGDKTETFSDKKNLREFVCSDQYKNVQKNFCRQKKYIRQKLGSYKSTNLEMVEMKINIKDLFSLFVITLKKAYYLKQK